MELTRLYNFVAGTDALAPQVNAEFDNVISFINQIDWEHIEEIDMEELAEILEFIQYFFEELEHIDLGQMLSINDTGEILESSQIVLGNFVLPYSLKLKSAALTDLDGNVIEDINLVIYDNETSTILFENSLNNELSYESMVNIPENSNISIFLENTSEEEVYLYSCILWFSKTQELST